MEQFLHGMAWVVFVVACLMAGWMMAGKKRPLVFRGRCGTCEEWRNVVRLDSGKYLCAVCRVMRANMGEEGEGDGRKG